MNVEFQYTTLTLEFEALRDRVTDLIDGGHRPSEGEWRESVLRSVIGRYLPDTVRIGRGFIVNGTDASTQCDVLLYRADCPVLFRDGDFVCITPDAVLGVIEVKTTARKTEVADALNKLADIGRTLERSGGKFFLGLFTFKTEFTDEEWLLEAIDSAYPQGIGSINFVCLGCDTFVRWWDRDPGRLSRSHGKWHAYRLERKAAGYFIFNAIEYVAPDSVRANMESWFPRRTKEPHLIAIKPRRAIRPKPPKRESIRRRRILNERSQI